jgi:hypothetical protein
MNKSLLIITLLTTVSFMSLAENSYINKIAKKTVPTSSAKAVTYDSPEEIIERIQHEIKHK